jgi:hypothetical protein
MSLIFSGQIWFQWRRDNVELLDHGLQKEAVEAIINSGKR